MENTNCVELNSQLQKCELEIQKLKLVLSENGLRPCQSCLEYRQYFQQCAICRNGFCEECENKYTNICIHCYFMHCWSCDNSTKVKQTPYHLESCHICTRSTCKKNKCSLCQEVVCGTCVAVCDKCQGPLCSNCINQCQENFDGTCNKCHLNTCGLCWDPKHYYLLPSEHRGQILTMLLVWHRLRSELNIPPKFIKLLIFRFLIHSTLSQTIMDPLNEDYNYCWDPDSI